MPPGSMYPAAYTKLLVSKLKLVSSYLCSRNLHPFILLFSGQGMKVCSSANLEALAVPHTRASREDVCSQCREAFNNEQILSTAARETYKRTVSYWSALQSEGCGHQWSVETVMSPSERQEHKKTQAQLLELRRGQKPLSMRCEGRLELLEDEIGGHRVQYVLIIATSVKLALQ